MIEEQVINLDDVEQKQKLLRYLGTASGKWTVSAKPHKPRRSLKSNARYWAAVVPAFRHFLWRHGQYFDALEVHEFFLQMFAARALVDPKTGEVILTVGRRSSKMDQEQFSEFTNHCEAWMLDRFGIVVPEAPNMSRAVPA